MSELTLTLIKFGFLALLWLFVLSAVSVIRSDMFGDRMRERPGRGRQARQAAAQAEGAAARRPRS